VSDSASPWLTGNRALVIGAGSGIGRAVCAAFLAEGAEVTAMELDAAKCEHLASELPAVEVVQGDATVLGDDRRAVDTAVARSGGLDTLVNCVGVFDFYRGLADLADDELEPAFEELYRVNVASQLFAVKAALPALRESRGSIVLTVSTSGFYPGRGGVLYVSSKFAVRGLTESLRYNLAPHRIGCSLCCPALTRTNAWTSALKRPDSFANSGFPEVPRESLEQFGTAFEEGMDPYEVGAKILAGMTEQKGLILTHPEHGPDFEEIHQKLMAALPREEAPPGRLKIEQLRREAMKAAEAGLVIKLDDLT